MFVITGGGTGIGRALALALAAKNYRVLIVGRREERLAEVASLAPEYIETISVDISVDADRAKLVKHIGDKPLSALIHNAATLKPLKKLEHVSLEEWQQAQKTNIEAPLFLTKALFENLQGGRVLHLSTAMAHMASKSWGCYCATKSALYMLYEVFKKEETGIAFGSVMPGITDTNMQALIRDSHELSEEDTAFFMRLHDEGLLLTPQTVAAFLCYLLLEVADDEFSGSEWDIYDRSHHHHWRADHIVPDIFGDS